MFVASRALSPAVLAARSLARANGLLAHLGAPPAVLRSALHTTTVTCAARANATVGPAISEVTTGSTFASAPRHDHTYTRLLQHARSVAGRLQALVGDGTADLKDVRVAFLYSGSFDYVAVLLGIWISGGIAVPLHRGHAKPELEHLLHDSGARALLVSRDLASLITELKVDLPAGCRVDQWNSFDQSGRETPATDLKPVQYGSKEEFLKRRAMFIYTSGTTGKPKGVVWTHLMFETQMAVLTRAWGWSATDHILHVLPLHHVHGVVNVLMCALYAGARCTFLVGKRSGTEDIAKALQDPASDLTMLMAVPTIYSRLLTHLATLPEDKQKAFRARCEKMRLMVSGSSALPQPVLDAWERATGHTLLERYGMSETGMILSQPFDLATRRAMRGTVGLPLPTVETKIVPLDNPEAASVSSSTSSAAATIGELRVKGPSVFREYWNLPEKTASEFDEDGWFRTGDVVETTAHGIRILGRASVDVLKSAGYKISALDVERELLSHPQIAEAAVVGVPDQEYGQVVAAIVALKPGAPTCDTSAAALQAWCRTRLAAYQIPRLWRVVGAIPRNAMGKTNKKELVKMFEKKDFSANK